MRYALCAMQYPQRTLSLVAVRGKAGHTLIGLGHFTDLLHTDHVLESVEWLVARALVSRTQNRVW
jgi:hypothetical protein